MKRYILAVIVALLATGGFGFVADAEAGYGGRPFGPEQDAAFAAAEAYWSRSPALCTSLSKEVVPTGALNDPSVSYEVVGRASTPNQPTACGIWIDEAMSGGELCEIMRHEYGHLLGLGHTETGIMAPTPDPAAAPDCYAAETEAAAVDSARVARRQAWELFREWRAGCRRERIGSPARHQCFAAVKRYGKRLQSRWS